MAYEEVNPNLWEYEKDGDFIEGVLLEVRKDVGANNSMLYTLELHDGVVKSVWGSAVLDPKMVGIKTGEKIRITYKGLGEKKPGKNPPKLFKVEVDREPAPAQPVAAQ